jgi:hypothetical protein
MRLAASLPTSTVCSATLEGLVVTPDPQQILKLVPCVPAVGIPNANWSDVSVPVGT